MYVSMKRFIARQVMVKGKLGIAAIMRRVFEAVGLILVL